MIHRTNSQGVFNVYLGKAVSIEAKAVTVLNVTNFDVSGSEIFSAGMCSSNVFHAGRPAVRGP